MIFGLRQVSMHVSHKLSAQEVTLFGLYFFRIRSQGVTALSSESETNLNNNLILRRAGYSSSWEQYIDLHVKEPEKL